MINLIFYSELVLAFLLWRILMLISDILTQIAALDVEVDALIVSAKPADLQPISDAITAVASKVKAATPAAP